VTDGARRFSAVPRRPRHSLLLWLVAAVVSTLSNSQPARTQETQSSNEVSSSDSASRPG
jgi:hypothetical protein